MTLVKSIRIYLLLAVLLAPSAVWVARDRTVWPWDQAWYGEVSTDLWFYLSRFHPIGWARHMVTGINLKPPAIVWIGQLFVPMGGILGSVEAALLLSILLTQAMLLWLIFQIGQRLAPNSPWVSIGGTIFAAAGQLFVGLSHQFFVEPLQALSVAWIVYIALLVKEWPVARSIIHLFAATLLGVLAKATTPLYAAVFGLYILVQVARRLRDANFAQEWKRAPSRTLAIAFIAMLPVSAVWYAVNLGAVWEHIRYSASAEEYGFRASFGSKLATWTKLLNESFLTPYLTWIMAGAIVVGAVTLLRRRESAIPFLLSLAQIVLPLALFSMNAPVDARYMFPIAVYLAVVLMSAWAQVPWRAVSALLLAACAVQWAAVNAASFGKVPMTNSTQWFLPPQPDPTQYEELDRAVRETSMIQDAHNVVGVEVPWINLNSAAFFAAKNRLKTGVRSYYGSLGYAEKDVHVALKRLDDMQIRYVITLDEPHQANSAEFLNVVSLPVLREIERSPHFRPVSFPSSKGVLIFERR
jgi:hypothetical protein